MRTIQTMNLTKCGCNNPGSSVAIVYKLRGQHRLGANIRLSDHLYH